MGKLRTWLRLTLLFPIAWPAGTPLTGSDARAIELDTYLSGAPAVYSNVFPGVSLRISPHRLGKEYDWIVAPGADLDAIVMRFRASPVSVDANGDLIVGGAELVRHTRPRAFQEIGKRRVAVGARFKVLGLDRVGFSLGPFVRGLELVIDPVVLYSVSLAGSPQPRGYPADEIDAVAFDNKGCTYIMGTAFSSDFPTTEGAYQRDRHGRSDLFVAKIDRDGKALVFSTLLGGMTRSTGLRVRRS